MGKKGRVGTGGGEEREEKGRKGGREREGRRCANELNIPTPLPVHLYW